MRLLKYFILAALSIISFYHYILFVPLIIITIYNFKKDDFKIVLTIIIVFFILSGVGKLMSPSLNGKYAGLIIRVEDNYVIVQTLRGRYYYGSKNNMFEAGDIISFAGTSKQYAFSHIEKGFNFSEYLAHLGVKGELEITYMTKLFSNPLRIKQFKHYVLYSYTQETKTLVEALIFNSKNYDSDLIKNFLALDLIFLLSSSGLHINFFMSIISTLTSLFTIKREKVQFIPLLFIIPLCLLNIDKFIFYRIFMIKTLNYINKYKLSGRYDYLSIIAFSGLIFLSIDHYLLFNMSFYVSYGLTLTIYFSRPLLERFKKPMRPFILISIIYAFMLPVRISQNNFIAPLSMLFQIAIAPMVALFFVFAYIGVFLGGRGHLILNPFAKFISTISKLFPYLNFGISARDIGLIGSLVLIVMLMIIIYGIETKHIPLLKISTVLILINSLAIFAPIEVLISDSIAFINVGQGDATLIQHKNISILIDTGGSHYTDIATESLIPYFHSRKINNIDTVIITHDDFDHNGALSSLQNNFRIKNVITEGNDFPFTIGSLTFHNLNNVDFYDDDNERSLIVYLEFMHKRWLFMGDASVKNEKAIITNYPNLRADILKVGHHGSKTSSSLEFLQHINTHTAIISAGLNNFYGHPHQEVLDTLASNNITVRRTDVEGTILYQKWGF